MQTSAQGFRHWTAWSLFSLLGIALLLSSCSSVPTGSRDSGPKAGSVDVSSIPDAVPRVEPRSRYGNPDSYVVFGKRYYVKDSSSGHVERGIASWYGRKFHGRRTSSGETYDMYAMTAAHKSLPLPTYVEVTNLDNGRRIVVKVNDRGPFHAGRIIDLSYTAASKLGIIARGTGNVEIRAIDPRAPAAMRTAAHPAPAPVTLATATPAPTPAPIEVHAVTPTVDHETPGVLYLQVGAFSSRQNAEKLRSRLLEAQLPGIRIAAGMRDQNPVYRVHVGPLQDVAQATTLAQSLSSYGIQRPHMIID